MPSASRNANRKRRQRRKISLLTRTAAQSQRQLANHHFVLMAMLHQSGGAMIVSQDVVAQIMQGFQHYRWKTENIEGAMRVVLEDTRTLQAEPDGAREDRSVTAQLARDAATSDDTADTV